MLLSLFFKFSKLLFLVAFFISNVNALSIISPWIYHAKATFVTFLINDNAFNFISFVLSKELEKSLLTLIGVYLGTLVMEI